MKMKLITAVGAFGFLAGFLTPDWAVALSCVEPQTTIELVAGDADLSAYVPEGSKPCAVITPNSLEIIACDDPLRFNDTWTLEQNP